MRQGSAADVVIVGAGIVGVSIAWALSQLGPRRIVILDRAGPGSGATGRSGALIRMHYTNPHSASLALRSFDVFEHWADRVGGECGFTRSGFIRLVSRSNAEKLRGNVARLQRLGARTRIISAADVHELFPACSVDDFDIAAYEPDSGYGDPWLTTHSLLDAARRNGVEVLRDVMTIGIQVSGGRVAGVRTAAGDIAAETVVVATGAWANELLGPIGMGLPITPYHERVAVLSRPAAFGGPHPSMIDGINQIYLREDKASLTLVGNGAFEPADPNAFAEKPSQEYFAHVFERVCSRVPAWESASAHGGWAGVDGMTPDGHPILGELATRGLYAALGMSGTGYKVSPGIGLAFAEMLDSGRPVAEIRAYRPERFAEGDLLRDPFDYHDRADTSREDLPTAQAV
jgi:sarcosine oxidase subunit beta